MFGLCDDCINKFKDKKKNMTKEEAIKILRDEFEERQKLERDIFENSLENLVKPLLEQGLIDLGEDEI